MTITTTKLSSDSYTVDSAGNVKLVKLNGVALTTAIPIEMWGNNWTLPTSGGNNKNEIAAIAENKAADNSISYSIAVKQTTTQNFGGQTNQTTIQWQYLTGKLNTAGTKLEIDGNKAVWNVQFPGQYETLLGIDMNGDSVVGVVKTLDTQALGSVQIKRDTDGGIYLVEGSQETALNTSNNNFYEQSQLNTMPTPFEMPNGFIQSANKNTRKVVGVEKGDIVQKSALNLFEKLFASVTLPTLTGSNSDKAALVITAITPALEKSLALGAQIANMLSLDKTGAYDQAWMNGFKAKLTTALSTPTTFPTFTPDLLKTVWDAQKSTTEPLITSLTNTYWLLKQEMNTMVGKPKGTTTTEELVTWQSWIIDKATLTNGVLQASEVKRDFKPGLLEELFKRDINKDTVIGIIPTVDAEVLVGDVGFARDSDLGAYLKLGTDFIEIKPESGMLNLEWNNPMSPPGRKVVAMTKLDSTQKVLDYKQLQTNFTGNLNDTNKVYYVLASSEKTPEGTSNYQFNLVTYDTSLKTATLIQNQSQWTKSAADWEGFFNKDLNKDSNIGRGTLTQVTGDLGTERMFKDADGAFFIVEGTVNGDVFTRTVGQEKKLQDPAGNQPMLEFGGANAMASSKVIAVKKGTLANFKTALNSSNPVPGQIINDSDTGYFILMQRKWKTPADSVEKSQWEVFVAKTDGRFNFNPIQVDAVGKIENFFDQDLNGDGVKGFSASAAVKQTGDAGTVYVARADGNPFIVDITNAQATKIYDIKMKDGGMMQLEFSNSWAQGSNKRELLAAERDATDATKFYLAVKNTNSWTEYAAAAGTSSTTTAGTLKTQVNWEVFTLSLVGNSLIMDWNNVSRGNSILGDEAKFNQDLSGDGKIGPDLTQLTAVSTDIIGSKLLRTSDGTLFIQNGTSTPFIVSNAQGLENSNSWTNGSFKSEAIAVEKLDLTSPTRTIYKIAIKSTNVNKNIVFNGTTSSTEEKTDINWNIITLDSTGKVLWGNANQADMPVWTKSVASHETQFQQDLNSDGVIGLDAAKLSAVATDKGTATLKRDAEKTLYVNDGASTKAIPNSTWFEFDNNWGNGSNKREAFAVEKVGDVYLLAFKTTNTFNGQSDVNWEIQTLNKDSLEIVWVDPTTNVSNTVWTKNIASFEQRFTQDLNGDGATGLALTKLKPIVGDLGKSYLAKDDKPNQAEQGYYIVKKATVQGQEDTAVALDSSAGFEYNSTWTDGSGAKYTNKREAVAVEYINVTVGSTTTPTPYLLFKTTSTKAGAVTELRWDILPLDATTLKPDWSKSTSTKSIVIWEGPTKFNQDLNGDGVSTGVPDNLTLLPLDKDGAKLARDKDGGLYIQDGTTTLSVQTPGSFEFSNSWDNGSDKGSNKQEAIAVQKTKIENVDYYIIAFKNTNEFNSEKQINWQIMKFDLNGSMIQPTGGNPNIWTKSISPYEKADYFNDDLNGDGAKGIDATKLTPVTTDTHGVGLARDTEKSIYITETGQTPVLITNAGGLENKNTWTGGSHERIVVAALKITTGTGGYKILIKNTNINSSNTDVNWQVAEVKASGEIDWSKGSPMVRNVQSLEADFNQDLNGDGKTGVAAETLTAYATNSDGNLLKSSTGEIFIRKDVSYIAVKDEFGNQPILDSSAQWSGGGFASTPYALLKQADNSYKLAIKMVETINSTIKTSWQIQTISATGVLDSSKTLNTKNVLTAEDVMGLDLDGDKAVGITKALLESKLTKITTDTTNDTLLKDANSALYIKMAVAGAAAGDDLLKVTDAAGGSPSFDTVSTWNNGASSRSNTAFGVQETGTGTGIYKLVSKVVSSDAKLVKTGWEIFTLNKVGSNVVIDSSKTIWTDNILTAEKVLGQDINGDGDFSGLPKSLTTLELDKVGTGGKYDINTGAVYINGDLLVTSSNGDSAKLVFTEGALRSEVVAISDKEDATNAFGNGANTYDIAISKSLSMALGTQTNWEILTVDAAGKTTKSVDAGSITSFEKRFGQDLNGDGVIGSDGITKISVITQDPDVWKDAWGGIYLVKRADKTSVQLKDNLGNAPNFDSLLTLPTGDIFKSELFAVEEQTNNKFMIAVKNTFTLGTTEQVTWMVYTAEATGIMDWANTVMTEDISTYETAFNFNLDGKDNIVIVGAVV